MIKLNKKKPKNKFSFKYFIFFFQLLLLDNLLNNKYKIIHIIKRNIKYKLFKAYNNRKTHINTLYMKGISRFGNYFISLNNAIIFCELFSCKRLIIENDFINHRIFYQKYNLTIESNYSYNNFDNDLTIINREFFYYQLNFTLLGKVNRFDIFKNEILNNLPKVKINFDDLYIYIRGGDIFSHLNASPLFCPDYYQPPLCFYRSVLRKFIFRKITIISENTLNPVIPILLKEYPKIKYNKNDIKLDLSYLANSYNIISATSSFIVSIIKLNQNIKFLWEYDIYQLLEKYLHLHYSVYTFSFNYTIYKMNASENYKKLMYPFHFTEKQRQIIIEEICDNKYHLIPPRIS